MKIGDILIAKTHIYFLKYDDPTIDYIGKKWEIQNIISKGNSTSIEVGDCWFNLLKGSKHYIFNFFYTTEVLRLKKLKSL